MADVLALVSKAVFDKAAREASLDVGAVWPTASYASAVKGLNPLADGGRLFLATVRPPDEALWLVGVLEQPKFDGKQWKAKPNAVAIRDVSALKKSLVFANGAGLPAEKGKLGMSLQTPRVLTEADAKLLADAKATPPKTVAKKVASKPAKARPAERARASAPPAPAVQIDEEALLARWRKTRSPRLADLLCCVPDATLADKIAGIKRAPTQLDATRLMRNLSADDPRLTVFLVESLQKARWPGSGATKLWKDVFAKLVTLKDKRAAAPLAAMVTNPPHFLGAGFTKWCIEQIQATADTLADLKQVPDDAETIRLAEAQVATVPPNGWFHTGKPSAAADELIAKVFAAPDDLELRSVVGDALLELGDPWGELIAMQATAKKRDDKAIKAFVRKHGARLAGGIAHVGSRERMQFDRGFLARCTIGRGQVGRRYWEEAATAPHWATVRVAVIEPYGEIPKWWFETWLAQPLPSLREIHVGTVVLARSPSTMWSFSKLPKRLQWRVEDTLEGVLRGLPVENVRALFRPTVMTKRLQAVFEQVLEDAS
jgi:hypothetical protein